MTEQIVALAPSVPELTQNPSDGQIAALVRSARELSAHIKSAGEELTLIEDRLKQLIAVGERVDVDGIPVAHRRGNRSFSKLLALASLSREERDSIKREMVDEKALRKMIEEKGLLEECMEEPKPDAKTSIRLVP